MACNCCYYLLFYLLFFEIFMKKLISYFVPPGQPMPSIAMEASACGAILGTSTFIRYIASGAGAKEGGKTGITSVFVGASMMSAEGVNDLKQPIREIDWDNFEDALPAFLTVILMPLTYSIANGLGFGIMSYVLIRTLTGKFKTVAMGLKIISVILFLYYFCLRS